MRRKMTIVLAVAFLAPLLAGCLFDPREAAPPGTGGDECWIVPNTPKDVFANLDCGLASSGNSSYDRSLGDDFVFIPRPGDEGGGSFDDWGKVAELDFLNRVKSEFQGTRTAQFGDADGLFEKENVSVGRAEYQGQYLITLDPGDGTEPQVYGGKAIFIVVETSTGWTLQSWEDFDVLDSYPTSGVLRGAYE
ncbi:MAG: hypothetical protein JW876_08105 [Candidatus Krumholzibacteriota bacterium]|nr:hypothetical protein [Candidatus Krumholzibacteriota bacterium]